MSQRVRGDFHSSAIAMAMASRRSAPWMKNTSIIDVWLAARITAPLVGTTSALTITVLITRVKPRVHKTGRIDHAINRARLPSPRDRGRLTSRAPRSIVAAPDPDGGRVHRVHPQTVPAVIVPDQRLKFLGLDIPGIRGVSPTGPEHSSLVRFSQRASLRTLCVRSLGFDGGPEVIESRATGRAR